ncbi:hypothetical protein SIN8267_02203 [Sinobacterium norvegicum]|uniref:VtpJ-therm n=1 Tax=Sinobacterium norvegicum TaxID=1641715 RepID=A0ABN8EI12_9GAMM|nr:pectinacetylesterase family protein [Sinobacterium norvegicum]CAH0992088.1 hypothetical protein SIN8267_02203 [Sinobacterium norvegicum]
MIQPFNTPAAAKSTLLKCATISVALMLSACGSDNNSDSSAAESPSSSAPFQEIIDQGVTRYLGDFSPSITTDVDDLTVHQFGAGDGPLCLDGSEYEMSTRDGSSEELVIYLEGGGGCWSDLNFCFATQSANAKNVGSGILDANLAVNPVKDANVAYFPYCDGSLFAGDADNDYEDNGEIRYQRGLKNLSAGLDVVKNQYPAPERIILTGVSGGGFGTIFALPVVRALYPDVAIEVINDSGLGVAKAGMPEFIDGLFSDWNAGAFVPASGCPDCYSNGHLTDGYFDWQLAQDPNMRLAMLSSKQDNTIGFAFLGMPTEEFEAALVPEMAALETNNPDRFRSFIINGKSHTMLRSADLATTADGVVLSDWLSDMLSNSDNWVSAQDAPQ